MTKLLANVEKISRPTAEIENAQWRVAIEPQILGALDIDLEPVVDVGKTIDARRVRPLRVTGAQIVPRFAIDAVRIFRTSTGWSRVSRDPQTLECSR